MEQSLRKYCILLILCLLCGCRHLGSFVTYAPVKESLLFFNNNVCIYTRYDMYNRDSIVVIDTCSWRYCPNVKEYIILCRKEDQKTMDIPAYLEDTTPNFVYEICPQWHGIKQSEFKEYADYKSPLHQDCTMSLPIGLSEEDRARINRRLRPTFADKYGSYYMANDTIVNYGFFMLWFRKPLLPLVLFANSKRGGKLKERDNGMYEMVTNSYEYINYKVNCERKNDFDIDSIIGRQYSYIGDPHKKESIRFVNDSICMHSLSVRADTSSSYMPSSLDTCRYAFKNNLIWINLVKGKSCDTLSYSNGILFYSKVYRNDDNENYTHIVKPFIDETRSCANKTDSINMIMSTYFGAYVPLNLYK